MKPREAILREILEKRFRVLQKANRSYSLRAFARDLKTTPATLSRILNGKSNLSKKTIEKLVKSLQLSEDKKEDILGAEMDPFLRLPKDKDHRDFVRNWQDAAIAALVETDDFVFDEKWIARRLNLPQKVVHRSLKRLFNLGILSQDEGRGVSVRDVALTSGELREYPDKNLIDKADRLRQVLRSETLENTHALKISTITMSIDPDRIQEAAARIRRFLRSLSKFLDRGRKREVYVLISGLFPVSHAKGPGVRSRR